MSEQDELISVGSYVDEIQLVGNTGIVDCESCNVLQQLFPKCDNHIAEIHYHDIHKLDI